MFQKLVLFFLCSKTSFCCFLHLNVPAKQKEKLVLFFLDFKELNIEAKKKEDKVKKKNFFFVQAPTREVVISENKSFGFFSFGFSTGVLLILFSHTRKCCHPKLFFSFTSSNLFWEQEKTKNSFVGFAFFLRSFVFF